MIGVELKDGVTARDLTFRNIRVRQCNRPFDFQILRRQDHPDQTAFSVLESAVVENLTIDRHAIDGEWFASHVQGISEVHGVRGLQIAGCSVSGKPLRADDPDGLAVNEFAEVCVIDEPGSEDGRDGGF